MLEIKEHDIIGDDMPTKQVIKKFVDSGLEPKFANWLFTDESLNYVKTHNPQKFNKLVKGIPTSKLTSLMSNRIIDWLTMGNFKNNTPCTRSRQADSGEIGFDNPTDYSWSIITYMLEMSTFLYTEWDVLPDPTKFSTFRNKSARAIITEVFDGVYAVHRIYTNTSAIQYSGVLDRICKSLNAKKLYTYDNGSVGINYHKGYVDIESYSGQTYHIIAKNEDYSRDEILRELEKKFNAVVGFGVTLYENDCYSHNGIESALGVSLKTNNDALHLDVVEQLKKLKLEVETNGTN